MITIKGHYYDGCSSAQVPVSICFYESGEVLITGEQLQLKTTLDRLSIAARLGDTQRNIFLSDGAKLETEDNDSVDRVCRYFAKNQAQAWLHKLERHWFYVLLAFFISAWFIWGGIEYGVPIAAKWTARSVPRKVEQEIGAQGLATLDKWLFVASTVDPHRRSSLQQHFQQITRYSAGGYHYRLLFRNSRQMGANAVALPGGIIVVTDALLELAENDEQLLAVLAHEMGHVEFQHGLRSVLQDSLTALFMAGLLGDITSVTSLSVTLPTILVESRYSREFELEADRYAVKFLKSRHISTEQYIRILRLLEKTHHAEVEFDYLSSHPAMDKRIDEIESQYKKKL